MINFEPFVSTLKLNVQFEIQYVHYRYVPNFSNLSSIFYKGELSLKFQFLQFFCQLIDLSCQHLTYRVNFVFVLQKDNFMYNRFGLTFIRSFCSGMGGGPCVVFFRNCGIERLSQSILLIYIKACN